jgi:UrcA family protein
MQHGNRRILRFLAQDVLATDGMRAYVGFSAIERSTGRIDVIVAKSLENRQFRNSKIQQMFQESAMKSLAIAMIATGLLAGASAATAADRESVSLKVDAADVNFADPASVSALRRQVERQIEQVCNPGDRVDADMKPDFKCRREMAANLDPTLYQLAARATARRMATVD